MNKKTDVAVLGAGISGLATAWWLSKAGVDVLVVEKEEAVGGTMRTIRENGWMVETGPNSALETTPLVKTLCEDAGCTDNFRYADPAGDNRYILRAGELHPLPMSPKKFFASRLWSIAGKLRLMKEPFVGKASSEETVAQFVTRRLGREFLDYAINPFVAGIFAGNPEQLSVRAAFPKLFALEEKYGGLIRGQIMGARERKRRAEKAKDRAKMYSFTGGMEQFPAAIAALLGERVMTGAPVSSITVVRNDGRNEYLVEGKRGGTPFAIQARAVVTAMPAYAAAPLLARFDSRLADMLNGLYYPPVVEVFLGYRAADVGRALDGFGFLIPALEKREILGSIWSSVLFPGRAPAGHAAFTSFVGGSRQPEMTARDDEELIAITHRELAGLMRLKGEPVYTRVTRWERAIPQYELGHLDKVATMEHFEREHPGFFIAGNFRGGISVGDCIINSEKTAERVKTRLHGR